MQTLTKLQNIPLIWRVSKVNPAELRGDEWFKIYCNWILPKILPQSNGASAWI